MKIGLQIPNFTWDGGPREIAPTLARIVRTADGLGFDSIWVMDHCFQIPYLGPAENEMLEGYTTLGFIAANTTRASIGTMVTGVTYRHPGVLIKQVTTLDVLTGGRTWLGIGAAWFEREHDGLGVPFPPVHERFERLEETLQIAHQMWSDDNGPFEGKHYRLAETICVPRPLSRPHPRIMIGGVGEKKTLRLVARYADASNIFGAAGREQIRHKLKVLRAHCEAEGRNYDDIEKTVIQTFDLQRTSPDESVDLLGQYADDGIQGVIAIIVGVERISPLETIGTEVIPRAARL